MARPRTLLGPLLVALVGVSALAASACGSRRAVDEDAPAAVRRAVEELILADNAGDLDRVLARYSEDALLLPPNAPPVRGRRAIAPRYRELFRDFDVDLEVTIDALGVSAEWAWCRGTTTGRFVPRKYAAAEETRTVNDTFLMILSRHDDGSWVVDTLMWHPAAP